MRKKFLKRQYLLLVSCVIITVDQASKSIISRLLLEEASKPLIPRIIGLRLVRNSGAAFSLFQDWSIFLGWLSLLASILLLIWILFSNTTTRLQGYSLAFLLGGSVGNGIDRWRYGYVVDFFEIMPFNFPIFNCADIAINIAALCFIIDAISRNGPGKSIRKS